MIRERPSHLSVVTLLEAEGLPASELTESHLEHFFFIGSDGAPSAVVGLEIYGDAALLRSPPSNPRANSLRGEQPCCYAKSDKYWVTDPTGIAWETFHTLGRIPVYGEDRAVFNHGVSTVPVEAPASGCCVPAQRAQPTSCCAK